MIFFSFCCYLLQDGNNKQAVPRLEARAGSPALENAISGSRVAECSRIFPGMWGGREGGKSDFECKGNENSGHAGMSP